jgi:hypothetical protein
VFLAYSEYIGTMSPDSTHRQRRGLFSSELGAPWQRCYRCTKPEKETKACCQKCVCNGAQWTVRTQLDFEPT